MQRLYGIMPLAVLWLIVGMAVEPIQAQVSRADSAAILLDATRRLELEGERAAARELLDFIFRHFPGTPAARAAEAMMSASRTRETETSGRASFIAFSTLYGAWLGIAVPAAFGADSPEPFGAGLLIGAPLAFFTSKAFVARYPMSSGQATLVGFGARWGTWQGIGWREVLGIGTRTIEVCPPTVGCYTYEDDSEEAPFTAAIVGGLTGLLTAGVVAQKTAPTHGTATMIELGSLWGVWYGFAGAVLANVEDDAGLQWALIGGNVGLVASAVGARSLRMGAGRARIISAAGLAGGVAGLGLDLLLDVHDEETAVLIPTLTSAVGLVAGGFMTRRFESGTPLRNDRPARPGLVNLSERSWSLGMPAPEAAPMLLPDRLRGWRNGVGVRISIFSAEF